MARWFRRTGSEVLGWTLVVVGIALLVLPGPGTLVLVGGIALLAPHYEWARRALEPLHERAVEAGKKSVSTRGRMLVSAAGALWILGLGILWLSAPTIPEFTVLGLDIGPGLPGGHAVGVGLLSSGMVAVVGLAYSMKRWYPGSGSN